MKNYQMGLEAYKELADSGDLAAQKELGKILLEDGIRYLENSVLSGDAGALEILSAALERTQLLLYEAKKSDSASAGAEGSSFAQIAVGDEVTFGRNPQSGEPMHWHVLDIQNGQALLLSKHIIRYGAFYDNWGVVTWESSNIRRYLNDEFVADAFSDEERSTIARSVVEAHEHPLFNTDPGNDTKDRIFLLSAVEVEKYFPMTLERKCFYCMPDRKGLHKPRWWWLRSPGFNGTNAATVREDGTFSYSYTREAQGGIRPALWRNI